MVTDRERAVCKWMIEHKLWRTVKGLWGWQIVPRWGTWWLYERLLARQVSDGLHHAPRCPANNWSGAAPVFQRCNCGAARMASAKEAGQ